MRRTVCDQMKLAPYPASVSPMLPDFPFAFTEDLQPGGINHQMCDFTPGDRFKTDIDLLCPLAETGVIRTVQRNARQGKMESIKPCAAYRKTITLFVDAIFYSNYFIFFIHINKYWRIDSTYTFKQYFYCRNKSIVYIC